jgi:hypothetical protein
VFIRFSHPKFSVHVSPKSALQSSGSYKCVQIISRRLYIRIIEIGLKRGFFHFRKKTAPKKSTNKEAILERGKRMDQVELLGDKFSKHRFQLVGIKRMKCL